MNEEDVNAGLKEFLSFIDTVAKNTEKLVNKFAQYYEVPNTTKERQDIGGMCSNVFPPHLAHFVKEEKDLTKNSDGWVSSHSGEKEYIHYSDGTECVIEKKIGKAIYGKIIEPLYSPTKHIPWWKIDVNPNSVEEVYYHAASMCLVIKLSNGKKIGVQSNSFMYPFSFERIGKTPYGRIE